MGERRIVTITTDFGTSDPWVGIMKGVMLSINPNLTIVDITHDIPAQDVKTAALCLGNIGDSFPKGTVHLCVVDPGVGSNREPIVIQTGRYFYVGPNNGVFSLLDSKAKKTAVIKNNAYVSRLVSATFHGRDVFAPVSAHLASTTVESFGPPVKKLVKLDLAKARWTGKDVLTGEIVYFDRYGNAFTNITKGMLAQFKTGKLTTAVGGLTMQGLGFFYQSAKKGKPGAIINGFGFLEIFAPNGDARGLFGLKIGDAVVVRAEKGKQGGNAKPK